MSDLSRPIARNLDEPTRIMGLAPIELGSCAVIYSVISPILKGIPFAALISLGFAVLLAGTILVLNRTHPPSHGVFILLQFFRKRVISVMPFGSDGLHEN